MPHIHTNDGEHDHTVSAFIINTRENTLLLHQHKIMKMWLQPGGHIELNEHPWQAIEHELLEETGYVLNQLNVLQQPMLLPLALAGTVHPLPISHRTHSFPNLNHKHTDAAYAFTTVQAPAHSIGVGESDSLTWFNAEELEELVDEIEIPADTKTIGLKLLASYPSLVSLPADSFHT